MSIDAIKKAADQILNRLDAVRGKGEEATKQALVLPMLDALGYNIWNPDEVCPEYQADFPMKKLGQREKVDLAVFVSGVPRIYVEVKALDCGLEGHSGQLARYFNATQPVSLALLTNGLEYQFFTDTGVANVMDSDPFFVVRLDSLDQGLDVLARFHKSVFSAEAIRDYATELNYRAKMAAFLKEELDLREREPSDNFVRWILSSTKMYPGKVTAGIVERLSPVVKVALQAVLRDIVRRSVAAIDKEVSSSEVAGPAGESAPGPSQQSDGYTDASDQRTEDDAGETDEAAENAKTKIITTERELECFAIMKEQFERSPVSEQLFYDTVSRKQSPAEIAYKDTTGYFAIYLNKPYCWIARAVVEAQQQWIGFNLDPAEGASLVPPGFEVLGSSPYAEFRIAVESAQDLHALKLLALRTMERILAERWALKPEKDSSAKARE